MTFLRNAWYMAAWSGEIESEALFSRRIIDVPILLYRKANATLVAAVDRCPHRFAPLSKGARDGDTVVCGYHGLAFDTDGQCVRNPFSERIPPNARIQTFPVVEKHTAIWIWPGDKALADEALIPDLAFMDSPAVGKGLLPIAAHYELLSDNLMDLSHIEFVHTGTFGGGGVIMQGQHSVEEEASGAIWSNWWMPAIAPPPWATFLPQDGKFDHWLEMRWNAPATMVQRMGIMPAGGDRAQNPDMMAGHIITPESATSSHYFYTFFNLGPGSGTPDDPALKAFTDEDKPMLEAVQANMDGADFWALKPVILNVDAASVRVRRTLAGLIQKQDIATPQTAVV